MVRTDRMRRRRGPHALFALGAVAWLALSSPLCASPWPSSVEDAHSHPCPMGERSTVAADTSCWCDPGVPCTGKLDDRDRGDQLHACVSVPVLATVALTADGSGITQAVPTRRRTRPPLFLLHLRFLE